MSCQSRNPETIGVEITNGGVGSAATTRVTFCRCRVSLHRVEILPGSSCADSWAGPYICDSGPRKTGIEPTFAGGLSPAAASDVPTRLRPSGVRIDAYVGLGWASVIHCRLCFVALHLVSGAPPSTSRAPPPLAKVRHCLFHLEPRGSHMPNQPVFATVEGGGVPCVSRSHLSGNFSFHFSGLIP